VYVERVSPTVERGVVGYIRVSTADQAESGAGLAAQRAAIEAEAAHRGWKLLAIHEDGGASGKSMDSRPALQAALADLKAKRADGLMVAKLDRLSRSAGDTALLLDRAQKERWALIALDFNLDTSTPVGEMVANVLASFAQYERRMIGLRTKEALAQKKAQGVRLGAPVLITEEVASLVARMRREGATLQAIANELNRTGVPTSAGGKQWRPSNIQRILQRLR
jgi:DNA invertase Pin-like site-specific DNA recombinase